VLPGQQQVQKIDVGANDLRLGKIARERRAFLSGRTSEGENTTRIRCCRCGGGEDFRISIESGPSLGLMAAGGQRSDDLREVAPFEVLEDALWPHITRGSRWFVDINSLNVASATDALQPFRSAGPEIRNGLKCT
jgi:hypothetical protein